MLAVLACIFVVVTLTSVTIQQSLGSISSTAQGRQLIQTVDAAEAGIQAEVTALKTANSTGPGTAIPCVSQQSFTTGGSNLADTSGVASYKLYMTDPGGSAAASSLVACPYSTGSNPTPSLYNVPVNAAYSVLIKSTGTTASGQAAGRALEALVNLADNQVVSTTTTSVGSTTTVAPTTTTTTVPATTTTTVPGPTCSSTAWAQAMRLGLNLAGSPNVWGSSTSGTTATNTGCGPNVVNQYQPGAAVTVPGSQGYTVPGWVSELAEADASGASYACSAVLPINVTILAGSSGSGGACPTTGSGSGGWTLDLSKVPGVNASSIVAAVSNITSALSLNPFNTTGLTLQADEITSWASASSGGAPYSSSVTLSKVTAMVTFKLLGLGALTQTVTVSINSGQPVKVTSATNLITGYIQPALVANAQTTLIGGSLGAALGQIATITADYTTLTGGVYTATGLHVALLNSAATADFATSQVGPNTAGSPPPPSTTTTTTLAPGTTTTAPPTTSTTTAPPTITTTTLPTGATVQWIKQVSAG